MKYCLYLNGTVFFQFLRKRDSKKVIQGKVNSNNLTDLIAEIFFQTGKLNKFVKRLALIGSLIEGKPTPPPRSIPAWQMLQMK